MVTGKYYLDCRNTRQGAYTTMHGKKFDHSATHWREVIDVDVGDTIAITDISNSGRHHCRLLKVVKINEDGTVETEIVQQYDYLRDRERCPICGAIV